MQFIVIVLIINKYAPIEQWIYRFETPEEALRFNYETEVKEIIYTVEIDDIAYINYVRGDGVVESKYLKKIKEDGYHQLNK